MNDILFFFFNLILRLAPESNVISWTMSEEFWLKLTPTFVIRIRNSEIVFKLFYMNSNENGFHISNLNLNWSHFVCRLGAYECFSRIQGSTTFVSNMANSQTHYGDNVKNNDIWKYASSDHKGTTRGFKGVPGI